MTLTWGTWRTDPSADPDDPETHATPYGDWYETIEFADSRSDRDFAHCPQHGAADVFPGLPLPRITLPKRALPGDGAINPPKERRKVTGLTGTLTPTSVIVGVIDAGIALSHDRFRRPDGGTRILSAWLQGGKWHKQKHLPFGRELMQGDIEDRMADCTTALGVDEGAFNRRAGLVDYAEPSVERWIDTAAPHGTHVADLAAGFDPEALNTMRDRLPMIVVDLAPRVSVGPSGSFLEFYVMWAIRHIAETADAIWDASFAGQAQGGFPVVINLSYGLLAGPKDGTMAIQKYIAGLNAARQGRPPMVMVLPAGNDNLERGVAMLSVAPVASIDWRISPQDHTSNYVEVWTDAVAGPVVAGATHPLAVALHPPGGPAGPGTAGAAGQVCDLIWNKGRKDAEVIARIYCRQTDNAMPDGSPATSHRLHYVICTAPSWRVRRQAAPSGAWPITLSHQRVGAVPAQLCVQSDQDLTPGHGLGRLTTFDDPAYAVHDPVGRWNDTYMRDMALTGVTRITQAGPVRQENTLNAIAGSPGTLTVAGYRASDGMPADYSSAGRDGTNPLLPDFACVSDDGVWRIGRMAAGARSGSAAVLQGTSFATGEATRIVAHDLLRQLDAGVAGPALQVAGAGFPPDQAYAIPTSAMPLKLGARRLAAQDHGRLPR